MAELSKIKLPNGSTYDIKDATARAEISNLKLTVTGSMTYLGVTSTELAEGSTATSVTIGTDVFAAKSGDVVIYGDLEFIYSEADGKWHEFGSTGSLKALAFKDGATGTYTPDGTVSQPTFTGTQGSVSVSGTPNGSISVGTGDANYTPAGELTGGAISVTPSTTTKYVASSATGGGSVSPGEAAQCTLPTLTTSVANETLTIGWSAGSFTANTPTSVTLPSFASQTIATGISNASISTLPTFSGTGVNLAFNGSSTTSTGTFTPSGTVSQPTFTGSEKSVSVS